MNHFTCTYDRKNPFSPATSHKPRATSHELHSRYNISLRVFGGDSFFGPRRPFGGTRRCTNTGGEFPRPNELHPSAAILLKMRGRGLPEGWPRPTKVAPFFDWRALGPFVQPRATICPLPSRSRDRCPPTSPPFFASDPEGTARPAVRYQGAGACNHTTWLSASLSRVSINFTL